MIISKPKPPTGIRFAWLPVRTDEGKVWLEMVHYQWNDAEFGSYTYRRIKYTTDHFGCRMIDYDMLVW